MSLTNRIQAEREQARREQEERDKQAQLESEKQQRRAAFRDQIADCLSHDGNFLTVAVGRIMPEEVRRKVISEAAEHFKSNHRALMSQQGTHMFNVQDGIGDANDIRDGVVYGRVIGDLPPQEKQALIAAVELDKHGFLDEGSLEYAAAAIAFNNGDTTIYEANFRDRNGQPDKRGFDQVRRETELKIRSLIRNHIESPGVVVQQIANVVSRVEKEDLPQEVKRQIGASISSGATWFASSDIANSSYQLEPGKGLFLGQLEDGGWLHYDGEGSLFTIAPPGAGKTQCQVMPNLILYGGPAIVLDVKGECYEQTAGYRSREYGRVLRFAPDDWDHSAHYNPLDFVRKDTRYLASDARKLADMLIVPKATSDPYWEQRGRDVLAALVGFVAYQFDEHERNMKSVMDLLSPSPAMLEEIIDAMRETEISFLERSANQIDGMSEKQLSSIFDSARSQLSVWDLGELDPITDRSDWHPQDFKTAGDALTLYLCVGPADIERFASVLRVIIGQHLDYFMEVLPDNMSTPIVFFLDEAPQLGGFEPLPKASSLGRQYGLRLWLFAQNRNQIEAAYKSADTILGNAVVQCWMNPDETAAHELERNLGTSRGLLDGQERPLVQSHELRGPDFKDTMICVRRGEKPAKLRKYFAYQDSSLKSRMGLPIEVPTPAQ